MAGASAAGETQLPHLETFAKAAELNSFTGAARALRLTQAAVSQRVQLLERSLGTPLFERRGGRVLLTAMGQRLYDYARRIFDLHVEARRTLTGRQAPLTGELLLAASSIPGEHLLPALLADFSKTYPHVRVHATVSDSRAVMDQVEHGHVQLGLVGQKDDNPHLEFRYLTTDHMVLVAPSRHPLTRRRRLTVQQLLDQPLVLREVGSGSRHCLEAALKKAGRSLAEGRVALELGSNEAIKEAVLRGTGVAVLSESAVHKEVKARRLKVVKVADLACERDIYLVMDRRRVLPIPARLFLTYLESHPSSIRAS